MARHIRNPIEVAGGWFVGLSEFAGAATDALKHRDDIALEPAPALGSIALSDLREILRKGLDDFGAFRADAIMLCLIYPVAGFALVWMVTNNNLLPMVFPLLSGFALLGPIAGIGLCELSRRREQAGKSGDQPAMISRGLGAIIWLALLLVAIFFAWIICAYVIFRFTLGPEAPASITDFLTEMFTTGAGWLMIVLGFGVGFCFALLVLMIGVISFPLLLDRNVGTMAAIRTSVRSVLKNPVPMAAWGLIVAAGLLIGSIPALVGLIIVIPVLGHANWHLYRAVTRN